MKQLNPLISVYSQKKKLSLFADERCWVSLKQQLGTFDLEAIAALEKRPRGIYTGSIGYLAANGDFDFNIAIRTLIVHPEYLQLQLGGAIVIDSDPVQEFEETLHKEHTHFSILGMREILWV